MKKHEDDENSTQDEEDQAVDDAYRASTEWRSTAPGKFERTKGKASDHSVEEEDDPKARRHATVQAPADGERKRFIVSVKFFGLKYLQ